IMWRQQRALNRMVFRIERCAAAAVVLVIRCRLAGMGLALLSELGEATDIDEIGFDVVGRRCIAAGVGSGSIMSVMLVLPGVVGFRACSMQEGGAKRPKHALLGNRYGRRSGAYYTGMIVPG